MSERHETAAIVHRHTDKPVCPWCGAEKNLECPDVFALENCADIEECSQCEGGYWLSAYVRVTYTTERQGEELRELSAD